MNSCDARTDREEYFIFIVISVHNQLENKEMIQAR